MAMASWILRKYDVNIPDGINVHRVTWISNIRVLAISWIFDVSWKKKCLQFIIKLKSKKKTESFNIRSNEK